MTAGGTIRRIPKGGGTAETIATGQLGPWGIAVDDERAYWANQGTDAAGAPGNDGSIMALEKSGGSPVVLAAGEQMPTAITLSSGTLVWPDGPWGAQNGMIRSLGLDAGAPTTLASNLDYLWIPVVADGRVYFTIDGDLQNFGTIDAVPLAADAGSGGNPVVALFPSMGPMALAADPSFLYYAAMGDQPGAL